MAASTQRVALKDVNKVAHTALLKSLFVIENFLKFNLFQTVFSARNTSEGSSVKVVLIHLLRGCDFIFLMIVIEV